MMRVLAGFIKKEFSQTLRDPVMRVFLLIAPVLQMLVLGYAINTDFKNISLVFIHKNADTASVRLAEKMYASGWFKKVDYDGSDPFKYLQSGRADAVLIMPGRGFSSEAARGEAKIQLLIDAQNATKARAVESYVNMILARFIRDNFGSGKAVPAVTFDVRVLYNPSMETPLFVIPALMTMIICLATLMLTSMSIAREKELGTFESIISAPISSLEIILGKTVPYVIVGLVDGIFIILAGIFIFGVPLRGSVLLLALATLVFVCTAVSIGTLISTFAANQQQAMMGTFLFLFTGNLLSGMMFPVENMPFLLRLAAMFNPLKYFIDILRNIMLKGDIPGLYWPNLGVLAVMMVVAIFAASRRFHSTLN